MWGNHDAPLSALGVPRALRFVQPEGNTLLVTHGDQSDPALKKIWGLATAANFVAGHFERLGLRAVSHWMGQLPQLLDPLSRANRPACAPQESRLARWAGAQAAQVVACGHSHALALVPLQGGRLLVNTGSHAHAHFDWAEVDLALGEATTWRDGRATQRAKKVPGLGWQLEAP